MPDSEWNAAMPEVYDECLGAALFAPYASLVAAAAARQAPGRVLELAAGTGILTTELLRALPSAELTATDLNPAMVARGAARVPGPLWRQADAQQLDLAGGSVDLVACQFGAMFFPDKAAAFAETARVLRPGGCALFTTWDRVEASDLPAAMVASLRAVLPEDPPRFIERVPHGYFDAERIAADLQAGGLTGIDIQRVVLRGQAESAAVLARGFCLGTPLRFELQERGALPDLTRQLAAELTALLGPGPVTGRLTAFLITAQAPD